MSAPRCKNECVVSTLGTNFSCSTALDKALVPGGGIREA